MNIKKWSRRRKAIVITIALLSIAAVAFAAFIVKLSVTGGGQVHAAPDMKFLTGVVLNKSDGATAAVTINGGGKTAVIDLSGFAGDFATIRFDVVKESNGSTVPLFIDSFRYSDVTTEEIVSGLGAQLSTTGATTVDVKLTIQPTAPAGGFSATADAGLYADDAA